MSHITESEADLQTAAGGFADLGLSPELLAALEKVGFVEPTDIQRELIPPALAGRDCLGQARTGTGKTAAFALPILQRIEPGREAVQALVLVPTRELALQVDEHVRALATNSRVKTLLVYGGTRIRHNLQRLRGRRDIVIGTPGRILDLLRRGALDLRHVKLAVLDEVDRMLDIGFRDDIRKILRQIKHAHQTIFVSATIDEPIRRLARSFMTDPIEINVSEDKLTVDEIEQEYVSVDPRDKYATLLAFLRHEQPRLAIVFTNTRHAARRVAARLLRDGLECREIHGDLPQQKRERVLKSFRDARIQVLVATDLASRGIDVLEVSHIVNYDIPQDPSIYVHRIGRTARMGRAGYALTLATPEDGKALTEIEKLINSELKQLDAPWVVRRHKLQAIVEPPAEQEDGPILPKRLLEAVSRDDELESAGVKPLPKTLGGRFRSGRRRR